MNTNQRLRDGVYGEFRLQRGAEPEEPSQPGFIRLLDDGHLKLVVRSDREAFFDESRDRLEETLCRGESELGSVLLTDRTAIRCGFNPRPTVTPTSNALFQTGAFGLLQDPEPSDSCKIQMDFPQLVSWHQDRTITGTLKGVGHGSPTGYEAKFREWQHETDLRQHRLCVGASWLLSPNSRGATLAETFHASFSGSASDLQSLVGLGVSFQNLINMAADGFVECQEVTASIPDEFEPGTVWNRQLRRVPPGIKLARSEPNYLFSLSDIGGTEGIARWIELSRVDYKSTGPLSMRYRTGADYLESELTNLYTGIEYWVKSHKDDAAEWASTTTKPWPTTLANHLGATFLEWLGDGQVWGLELKAEYDAIKHDSRHHLRFDPNRLSVLTASARLALLCALLVHCSQDPCVVDRVLNHTEPQRVGKRVRELFKT